MANLKTKTDEFINLSGEMATGGAPIFADDILRIQENSRADYLNYFEALRRLLPFLPTWNGASLVKRFENGLILSGLEYDNTDPANPIVSEGYILSGGEVCYYPGGPIATGGVERGLLYLYKGAAVNTARVFNVGGSKNILVTHSVVVEVSNVTVNGLELAGGSAITGTDEVVVLGIGVAGPFLGEDYFTARTAQGVTGIGNYLNESAWSGAVLLGTQSTGTTLPYIVSRVNSDGTTEVRGSVKVPAAAQSGSSLLLIGLLANNINTANLIPLNARSIDPTHEVFKVTVNSGGSVSVQEPTAGWPGVDLEIVFNERFLGVTTLPTPFEYVNAFLDIT